MKKKTVTQKETRKTAKPLRDLAPLEGRTSSVKGGRARNRNGK